MLASKFVTQKGVQSGKSHTVNDGTPQNMIKNLLAKAFLSSNAFFHSGVQLL
jgi:hypothetical protein